MSLLLDALKKAALEKQRRSQSLDVAAEHGSDSEALLKAQATVSELQARPSRKGKAGSAGAELLSSWAQPKRSKRMFEEGSFTPDTVEMPMAQVDLSKPAAERADPAESSVFSAITDNDDDASAGSAACEFIDISDLDFAALVGFVEPEPLSVASTQALDTPSPHTITTAAPTLEPQVPGAASTAELANLDAGVVGDELIPEIQTADTPVDVEIAQSATEPPTSAAATSGVSNPPAQFSPGAGKQALAALLSKSQKIASRNRRRLTAMYCLLLVTAAALVGIYYYLLHRDDAPLLLAPPVQSAAPPADEPGIAGPISEAPAAATVEADEAKVAAAEASISADLASQAATVQPPSPTTETAIAERAAPANDANFSPDSDSRASEHAAAAPQAEPSPRVVINRDPTSGLSPVVTRLDGEAEPAAPTPVHTGTTAVLAYQPAPEDTLASAVERGYAAFEAGDLDKAAQAYQQALSQDANQRDALLGAAAVALQKGQANEALNFYQQRLARAPKDDYAQAGILAIGAQTSPNPQLDSELNRLLLTYPQAAHLHYLQGTLYAQRQQWAAAQLAFLAAWQLDNQNPNVACDLAIAFDHLQVPEEARRFYRQALSLSQGQTISFSAAAIRARLAELDGSGVPR
ncbi:MAG TPA: tetratricopeptide repeat protein [Cellvibrionaceae bacterium]